MHTALVHVKSFFVFVVIIPAKRHVSFLLCGISAKFSLRKSKPHAMKLSNLYSYNGLPSSILSIFCIVLSSLAVFFSVAYMFQFRMEIRWLKVVFVSEIDVGASTGLIIFWMNDLQKDDQPTATYNVCM